MVRSPPRWRRVADATQFLEHGPLIQFLKMNTGLQLISMELVQMPCQLCGISGTEPTDLAHLCERDANMWLVVQVGGKAKPEQGFHLFNSGQNHVRWVANDLRLHRSLVVQPEHHELQVKNTCMFPMHDGMANTANIWTPFIGKNCSMVFPFVPLRRMVGPKMSTKVLVSMKRMFTKKAPRGQYLLDVRMAKQTANVIALHCLRDETSDVNGVIVHSVNGLCGSMIFTFMLLESMS